jgi:hypothetical protein
VVLCRQQAELLAVWDSAIQNFPEQLAVLVVVVGPHFAEFADFVAEIARQIDFDQNFAGPVRKSKGLLLR